jgi:5-methylcytosine-specific restriction endonuclease McrA
MQERWPRLQLDPNAYRKLRQRILERDGWQCQRSGSSNDVQVRHIRARRQLGDDAEYGLITLSSRCHWLFHVYRGTARAHKQS